MMKPTLIRPEPILRHSAHPVDRSTPPRRAAERLRAGEVLIVSDLYHTGAQILTELDAQLRPPPPNAPFEVRQAQRRTHRQSAQRLLAPIQSQRLALRDGEPIGLLKELYPELDAFVLPLVQVQELYGAWQLYQEGVYLALLGFRIHPFYGTYVPTRVSHLELFGTWLSQYQGKRTQAIDVGTGCGVLALMLWRAGFERVLATDSNPNAIESVARELDRFPSVPPIQMRCGDLLEHDTPPADLIVFNPPWIRGEVEGPLDAALHFSDGFFERFFEQASARLSPSGRLVLVFSNVMELVQPTVPHPILAELERGRFRLVQKLQRKVKPTTTSSGQPRKTRERVEVWELAKA